MEELADGDVGIGVLHQVEACLLQRTQSQEHESNAKKEIANDAALFHVDEDDAHEKGWIHEVCDGKAHSQRHNPCRQGCSNVCAHDDADGLNEGEQTSVHEGDSHQGGRSRTLYSSCDKHTCEHTSETVRGHSAKHMA